MSRVGFIGLGNMGHPMAANLARGNVELVVSDVDHVVAKSFADEYGARIAGEDGSWSETGTVILMLPTSDVVEAVLLKDNVVAALPKGALVIDMSSSEPHRSRALGETLQSRGLRYVDAPVSGGVKGAVAATLAIMTGGTETDIQEANPLFELMGKRVFHIGPAGAGHAAKCLNNMVSAVTIAATSEALIAGEHFGIDPGMLNDVFNASSSRSNTTENKVAQFMLSRTFNSGFAMSLMAKDLGIARAMAHELHVSMPVSDANYSLWTAASDAMPAGTDQTALFAYLHSINDGTGPDRQVEEKE